MVLIRVSLFPGFSTSQEAENFQKIPGNPGKILGIREIFRENFLGLDYFAIFSDF